MAGKKRLFVVGSVIVIALLTGCGMGANTNQGSKGNKTESPKQNEIAAEFHPTIETIEQNNSVNVKYRVKNISGKAQKLTFPSSLTIDFIVYDDKGKKVKQHSDEVSSTQAVEEVTLENNEEIANEFTIEGLANGRYKIEVFLTAKEREAKVVSDLLVEKSTYVKGSGTLIGQMDPHTIEIDIEGQKTAFQLSVEAILQLGSIKEGDHVSFFYTEGAAGQKRIEKFKIE